MDILNVLEPLRQDEWITSYDYRNYFPYNVSQLDNSDEIRIPCHNSTLAHLAESCIYLEASLIDLIPETMNIVKLVKNFPVFLFSEARLELNGQVVDVVRAPGLVSTMKNYCLVSESEKSAASEHFWTDSVMEIYRSKTNFSCCIPLKRIFGLCQDYQKIIMYSKLELILLRSRTDLNCFAETTAGAGVKIKMTRVA